MIIGVDMDCSINTMDECWLSKYNTIYEDDVHKSALVTWEHDRYLKCSHSEYMALLTPDILRNTGVQPDAPEVLKLLNERHTVLLISAAMPETIPARWEWLQEHFPYLTPQQLIFCHKKSLVHVHVHIDDGLHNFWPELPCGLVYDQPWNQCAYMPPNLHRVKSWGEIARKFVEKGWL